MAIEKTVIRIAEDTLEKMSASELEEYLQGSGKPEGLSFGVDGKTAYWPAGDSNFDTVDIKPVPNFKAMTKEKIEDYCLTHYGVNLNTRMSKPEMVARAIELSVE